MQCPKVEGNDITGLGRTGLDPGISPPTGWISHQLEALCVCDIRRIVLEAIGDEPPTGCVATPEATQGDRLGNRVEGYPQTDVIETIDSVIRVIVMPRRRGHSSGFFHQDVLVEKPRPPGSHEGTRDLGQCSLQRCVLELVDSLPTHIVIEESTTSSLWRVVVGPLTRARHVLFDSDGKQRQSLPGNHTSQDDESITLICVDFCGSDENTHSLRLFTSDSLLGV